MECGTVGGWCGLAMGMTKEEASSFVKQQDFDETNLRPLFYPNLDQNRWNLITTEDAVKAIDNFLETGDPRWQNICPNFAF